MKKSLILFCVPIFLTSTGCQQRSFNASSMLKSSSSDGTNQPSKSDTPSTSNSGGQNTGKSDQTTSQTTPPASEPQAPTAPPPSSNTVSFTQVSVGNVKYCSKATVRKAAVYSSNPSMTANNLRYAITSGCFNKIAVQGGGSFQMVIAANGIKRFFDIDRPNFVVTIPTDLLNSIKSHSATKNCPLEFVVYDDKNNSGNFEPASDGKIGSSISLPTMDPYAFATSSNAIPQFDFQIMTEFFLGIDSHKEMAATVCSGDELPTDPNPCEDECDENRSPLAIDIAGNGFMLTSPQQGVLFDLDGSGIQTRTGWFTADTDDALLFRDLPGGDANSVDSGSELFGTATVMDNGERATNGFEALAEHDSNKDGVIDSRDSVFSSLKLWIDRNHNGRSEPQEIFPLSSFVNSIKVKYSPTRIDAGQGNLIMATSSVQLRSGEQREVADIWFAVQ